MRLKQFGALCAIGSLGAVAAAGPDEKLQRQADGNPALAKMSHTLLKARKEVQKGAKSADAMKKLAPYADRGGKTQCIIGVKSFAPGLLNALAKQGVEVVNQYSFDGGLKNIVVRCSDVRQLEAIAAQADVVGITEEPEAVTHSVGAADNQADRAMRAADARTSYSINGSGVRVGVLSDSFNSTRGGAIVGGVLTGCTDQASGDLPASIRIIDAGPAGSDEGNAMAQLIYDVAPGCNIAFASAFSGYSQFAANITALRTDLTAASQVIVDDVSYFAEPMYQDGPIAQAADACGLANVPYFSSAANWGSDAHERAYVDSNAGTDDTAGTPSGADLHDFGVASGGASDRFLTFNVSAAGGSIRGILHWDEPYGGTLGAGPGSQADLDLLLVNSTALPLSGVIAASTSAQGFTGSPSGEPYELIYATGLAAGTYHLVVEHYWGREPVNFSLIVDTGANTSIVDNSYLGGRTIYGHNTAANAIAVGAVNYFEWDPKACATDFGYTPGILDGSNSIIDVESFSSRGGNLPIWFTSNGMTRFGTAQTRFKPEITAPDGCDTTFFGSGDFDSSGRPNFFGTSAAAPNAAAVAALMIQRAVLDGKTPSAAGIYSTLRSTSRASHDGTAYNGVAYGTGGPYPMLVETSGPDFDSGDGVIDALNANVIPVPVAVSEFSFE